MKDLYIKPETEIMVISGGSPLLAGSVPSASDIEGVGYGSEYNGWS